MSTNFWAVRDKKTGSLVSGYSAKKKDNQHVISEMSIDYGSLDSFPIPLFFNRSKGHADALALTLTLFHEFEAYELTDDEIDRANITCFGDDAVTGITRKCLLRSYLY